MTPGVLAGRNSAGHLLAAGVHVVSVAHFLKKANAL